MARRGAHQPAADALAGLVRAARAGALACLLAAAGCNASDNVAEGLAVDSRDAAAGTTSTGEGEVAVALVVARREAGPAGSFNGEFVNGSLLAMEEIGGSLLRLTILDSTDEARTAETAAQVSKLQPSAVFVASKPAAQAAVLAAAGEGAARIAVAADTVAAPGAYVFAIPAQDLLRKSARAAKARGAGTLRYQFIGDALAGAEASVAAIAAEEKMTAQAGRPETPARALAELKAAPMKPGGAEMLVVAGTDGDLREYFSALANQRLRGPEDAMIAIGGLDPARLSDPALQGIVLVHAHEGGFGEVADAYRRKFGSAFTLPAAMGYDAIAMAASLAHSGGKDGFADSAIQSPNGFRGASGTFRFDADRRSRWRILASTIRGGQLVADEE